MRFTWIAVQLTSPTVVRQLVEIYQPAMAERHHEVTIDLEEHVVVDADMTLLNRVVSNLLENELTHLPAGCRVNIRLRSHASVSRTSD